MNTKDEELWVKKIRESLGDYSEPPPMDVWAKIEQQLQPALPATPASVEKKIYFYRVWASAAAVVILAVSGISLYFLNSPTAEEIKQASVITLPGVPDIMPEAKQPEALAVTSEPVISYPRQTASHTVRYTEVSGTDVAAITEAEENNDENIINEQEQETNNTPEVKEQQEVRREVKPSAKNKLHLPVESGKNKSASKGWSVGLSVNSSPSTQLDGGYSNPVRASFNTQKVELQQNSLNGVVSLPKDGLLYFDYGVPYYLTSTEVEYDHKQPISFGFSVRKAITHNISIETGLTYTMLNSDIKIVGTNSEPLKQKLHYVGLPIRANWNFIDSKRFTVYAAGGGMIEKCVYGSIDSKKETVKPVQLSLNAAVGGQYNITPKLGLYVEPGIAYFFDDGSDVETIRKEHPFNFNLQAGIRLSY